MDEEKARGKGAKARGPQVAISRSSCVCVLRRLITLYICIGVSM